MLEPDRTTDPETERDAEEAMEVVLLGKMARTLVLEKLKEIADRIGDLKPKMDVAIADNVKYNMACKHLAAARLAILKAMGCM